MDMLLVGSVHRGIPLGWFMVQPCGSNIAAARLERFAGHHASACKHCLPGWHSLHRTLSGQALRGCQTGPGWDRPHAGTPLESLARDAA
jgi:hypothetical protein